jgi:hypothetical protein
MSDVLLTAIAIAAAVVGAAVLIAYFLGPWDEE